LSTHRFCAVCACGFQVGERPQAGCPALRCCSQGCRAQITPGRKIINCICVCQFCLPAYRARRRLGEAASPRSVGARRQPVRRCQAKPGNKSLQLLRALAAVHRLLTAGDPKYRFACIIDGIAPSKTRQGLNAQQFSRPATIAGQFLPAKTRCQFDSNWPPGPAKWKCCPKAFAGGKSSRVIPSPQKAPPAINGHGVLGPGRRKISQKISVTTDACSYAGTRQKHIVAARRSIRPQLALPPYA